MSQGTIKFHTYESKILKPNLLKDSNVKEVIVYLPSNYKPSKSEGYLAVFFLPGFGSGGRSFLNYDPMNENLHQKIDRLIRIKKVQPMIGIFVDCFTKLGGNQYINSTATGNYADYIIEELVPFIDNNYNCSNKIVAGHSSGGYGSFILGMKNPLVFDGLLNHSGDAGFEYCYLPDFPKAYESFRSAKGPKRWLESFWKKPNRRQGRDMLTLNILAMAAHYSPNSASSHLGIDFPFDLETGEIKPEIWKMWLDNDPVRMVRKYQRNLQKLKFIYLDCGIRDEFNLHIGVRSLHSQLKKYNILHNYYEFDDGHRNTTYRYDVSLTELSNHFSS